MTKINPHVAILVDSCSDVPADFIAEHHLYMVPMTIAYHDEIFWIKSLSIRTRFTLI